MKKQHTKYWWKHKHDYMYTYQLRKTNKQIIELISITPRVRCFSFDFDLGIGISTKVAQKKPTRWSLLSVQQLNHCNDIDQERFSVVRRSGYRTLWESLTRLLSTDTSDKAYPKQLTVLLVQARSPKLLPRPFPNSLLLGLIFRFF